MKGKTIKIQVPGSTANLGPGFDALALALGIYTNLTFELTEQKQSHRAPITLKGPIAAALSVGQNNLIYKVLSNIWQNEPQLLHKVHITIESDIPPARGLGSSAAAILGTTWAANYLQGHSLNHKMLLQTATTFEGHADNLAASLLGGLVVCASRANDKTIVAQKLAWPADWHTLVVVPQYCLATDKARSVLPKKVPLKDAVTNIQSSALLVAAVNTQDEEALQHALHDKLHEPYRLRLVPELAEVRKQLVGLPYLGCVLSGAGSSILVIVNKQHKDQIFQCLTQWAVNLSLPPQVLDLPVDCQGLKVLKDE